MPEKTYSISEIREEITRLPEQFERDAELMAAFRQGVKEMAEGKGRPWEDVKKELGLE